MVRYRDKGRAKAGVAMLDHWQIKLSGSPQNGVKLRKTLEFVCQE
jgi:hypothetical protein